MPLELLTTQPASPLDAALTAFLLDREAARCTVKTLEHYRYTAGGFVAWLRNRGVSDVGGITPTHVRAYLVELQRRQLKDTTQHAHARGIKAWLNWLVNEGDLAESPMRRVSMPRLERRIPAPFAPDDVQRLLAVCDRATAIGARNYAAVLMLLDTGLRVAELASLKIGQVDMRSGMVRVFGKGQKERTIRAGSKARAGILRMLGYRAGVQTGDPLWIAYDVQGREVGALSVHGLQIMVQRLGRLAGVRPCGPHRFRRTFATWCLADGMDIEHLRRLMGHSSLAVLLKYLSLSNKDLERAHLEHSPVDRLL